MKSILEQPKVTVSQGRVMLFDLALGGHHGNYIRYLIEHWQGHNLSGSLDIVVLPQFLEFHRDVVEMVAELANDRLRLVPLKPEEAASLESRNSFRQRTKRNFQEWDLLCRYARQLGSTECLLMYFDTCELPLAVSKAAPCPISGIYFKPTFHYCSLPGDRPTRKDKIQRWREKVTLKRILLHPQLKTLFCLDPIAIEPLKEFQSQAEIVYLPDPVELEPVIDTSITKESLGIDAHRLVLIFFGALDRRKGLHQLVAALNQLPPEICRYLSILFVGKGSSSELSQIEPELNRLKTTTPLQIIQHYQFVPEAAVASYFQLADLVLAPYQKHVGMSGILLLAAAANKPVLSSDYGLMGELVRRYDLGLSLDSTSAEQIALNITQFVLNYPNLPEDRQRRRQFASEHSVMEYATTIFQHL